MGNLSLNLSRHEFACKCGCGCDTVDFELVKVIQDVCDNFNCSVTITSGHRCFMYNKTPEVGSNDNSQHPQGRAADCIFKYTTPLEVYNYLCEKYKDRLGLGLYNTFNHIDTRSGVARWSG